MQQREKGSRHAPPGRIRLSLLLLATLGTLASCNVNGPGADPTGIRIVMLGDSITEGVRDGVKPEQTFAALLEARLRAEGRDVEVVNRGVGGETTDKARKRLENDVIARKPRIVTIMYGTNDSFVDEGTTAPRIPIEVYRGLLASMIDTLGQAGIRTVLMTEPRWGPRPINGLGENPNPRLEEYVEVSRALAREYDLPLVDHFADWTQAGTEGIDTSAWTVDQCHPNPDGHQRMADLLWPVLRKEVEAVVASSAPGPLSAR